ncbi:hypothetical protein K020075H21_04590 [Bacteroides ovatus]
MTMRENRKVPFRDTTIRVSRNHDGMLHVSADDVCGILKRDELLKKGGIAKICPSAIRMPLRKGGHELWVFRPSDMRRLLQYVRKESILPRDLFDDLETWGNQLFELEAGNLHPQRQADTVCYFAEDFPVTFRRVGDKLMVNATQITMRYDKIPSEWLRIAATDHLRRELARTGQTDRYEFQLFTTRGRGKGATWIESPLLVPLARWIAPDTGLAEWCEEQLVMLAAGRVRHRPVPRGAETGSLPCLDRPLPANMGEALSQVDELRKTVREFLPKAAFYDEFVERREWFKSTRIADELNTSPRDLHRFLHEEGICMYSKQQWVVLPAYRSWQCDVPYTWENDRGEVFTFGSRKRWTPVGRECIIELWWRKHPEYR